MKVLYFLPVRSSLAVIISLNSVSFVFASIFCTVGKSPRKQAPKNLVAYTKDKESHSFWNKCSTMIKYRFVAIVCLERDNYLVYFVINTKTRNNNESLLVLKLQTNILAIERT